MSTPATTQAPGTYRLALGAHAGASRCARLALTRCLRDWGLATLEESAALVLGELVSNAAKLGAPLTAVLVHEPASVVIKVIDRDRRLPYVKDAAPDAEDGRGMFLVEAYSQSWGICEEGGGRKGVWARVAE